MTPDTVKHRGRAGAAAIISPVCTGVDLQLTRLSMKAWAHALSVAHPARMESVRAGLWRQVKLREDGEKPFHPSNLTVFPRHFLTESFSFHVQITGLKTRFSRKQQIFKPVCIKSDGQLTTGIRHSGL